MDEKVACPICGRPVRNLFVLKIATREDGVSDYCRGCIECVIKFIPQAIRDGSDENGKSNPGKSNAENDAEQ